jgi:hypothetical protein
MQAWKRIVTVEDPGQVVLRDLPFPPGQRVEVVVIADEGQSRATADELRRLLADTQALPASRTVTDEQIAEEVAAYRAGR